MCVCRCIKAIVSDSAFSVPPQQLITNDGGIIEIGAEVSTSPVVTCHVSRVTCHVSCVQVQYGITDVVVMVREVADHQDILRWAPDSRLTKYIFLCGCGETN